MQDIKYSDEALLDKWFAAVVHANLQEVFSQKALIEGCASGQVVAEVAFSKFTLTLEKLFSQKVLIECCASDEWFAAVVYHIPRSL